MQAGDYIRFRYTGQKAKILTDYLDGSFKVILLTDQEEIIAFKEDIIPENDFRKIESSPMQKEKAENKIKKLSTEEMFYSREELEKNRVNSLRFTNETKNQESKSLDTKVVSGEEAKKTYEILLKNNPPQNSGLWLAFLKQSEDSYTIYLINDSSFSIRFSFNFYLNGSVAQNLHQTIAPFHYFPIGEFEQANFNDNPSIELKCPAMNIDFQQKLKFKKWNNWINPLPIVGMEAVSFKISNLEIIANNNQKEDNLKNYTKQQLKEKATKHIESVDYKKNILDRLAQFKNEIDLHAEVLIKNYKELEANQIFGLQKTALANYMRQAIELGVSDVFIIHGIGEGKLRKAVDDYLKDLKKQRMISEFRNEYLSGYGFGATHVRI